MALDQQNTTEGERVAARLTVTVEQAAELLGIGRGLAYELARTGRLPVVRLGRRMVVPKARLIALLEGGAGPTGGGAEREP